MADGYQVIARRWRPKQFADVVGQEHVTRTLTNAIESGRIAHAYLFVGPRGTGKTSTARIFAKALNAEGEGPSATPDDTTELAKAIMAGTSLDVIEIDGASNNSVEQIRSLREDCQYAPAQGRFKVYIIDEVHMLTQQAFNALLKTLEEPPPHVKFIFATTEAQKVLPTIVSRCQRFEFRPIEAALIVERLRTICEAEGIDADAGALKAIARLADGGMRDSQSTLDQMISFCGERIREQDVLDVYGLAGAEELTALGKALAAGDYAALLEQAEALTKSGRDLYRVLVDLQEMMRTALLKKARGIGAERGLSTEGLMRALEALHAGEFGVQRGLDSAAHFEITLLRAAEASRTRALDAVIRELEGLDPEEGKKKVLR